MNRNITLSYYQLIKGTHKVLVHTFKHLLKILHNSQNHEE